jgi:hypothetical protein
MDFTVKKGNLNPGHSFGRRKLLVRKIPVPGAFPICIFSLKPLMIPKFIWG